MTNFLRENILEQATDYKNMKTQAADTPLAPINPVNAKERVFNAMKRKAQYVHPLKTIENPQQQKIKHGRLDLKHLVV